MLQFSETALSPFLPMSLRLETDLHSHKSHKREGPRERRRGGAGVVTSWTGESVIPIFPSASVRATADRLWATAENIYGKTKLYAALQFEQ